MIRKIKRKVSRKFKDKDFSEIFKKGATGFFISLVGRPLGLIQIALLIEIFGNSANGVFRVCLSILSLVGILGQLGIPIATSRFVSAYRKKGRYDLVNGVMQTAIKIVVPVAAFLSLAVFFLAPFITHYIYPGKPYTLPIQITSVGIFFFTLSGVLEEGIRGLKKIKEYAWINNVSTQAAVIVILLIAMIVTPGEKTSGISAFLSVFTGIHIPGMQNDLHTIGVWAGRNAHLTGGEISPIVTWSYVGGLIITFILGVYYWLKFVPYKKAVEESITKKELLQTSLPMLSVKYLTLLYTWVDTLILAAYVSDNDVSVYSVASRVTALVTLPLIAVNNIAGPKFAEAYSENDEKYLRKTVRISTRLIFWICLPIMVAFFAVPRLFLFVYGHANMTPDAILTFHIINIGQIINVLTGPVTILLNMTGRQKVSQLYAAVTMAVSIILCFVLIPSMGLLGAAIATAAARTVLNLGCALHVYFTTGISTIYNPFTDVRDMLRSRSEKKERRKLKKLNKITPEGEISAGDE